MQRQLKGFWKVTEIAVFYGKLFERIDNICVSQRKAEYVFEKPPKFLDFLEIESSWKSPENDKSTN